MTELYLIQGEVPAAIRFIIHLYDLRKLRHTRRPSARKQPRSCAVRQADAV